MNPDDLKKLRCVMKDYVPQDDPRVRQMEEDENLLREQWKYSYKTVKTNKED